MKRGFLDVSERVFNRSAERVLGDSLCLSGSLDSDLGGLCDSRTLQCGNLHNLAAELSGELVDVDFVAVFLDNVHHIDRHNNRDTELGELCCEIKVTLKVGTVNDIEDNVGAVINEVITCYNLLKCVRRERVDSGQVGDGDVVVLFELALLFLNRNARPVSNELVGACERVKQSRLAAVWVTGKRDFDTHTNFPFCKLEMSN